MLRSFECDLSAVRHLIGERRGVCAQWFSIWAPNTSNQLIIRLSKCLTRICMRCSFVRLSIFCFFEQEKCSNDEPAASHPSSSTFAAASYRHCLAFTLIAMFASFAWNVCHNLSLTLQSLCKYVWHNATPQLPCDSMVIDTVDDTVNQLGTQLASARLYFAFLSSWFQHNFLSICKIVTAKWHLMSVHIWEIISLLGRTVRLHASHKFMNLSSFPTHSGPFNAYADRVLRSLSTIEL